MLFTDKLKRLLDDRGMTQKHLAHKAGLGAAVLSKYVNFPKTKPRADIALRLAIALGVPLEWLVDDSKEWPPPPAARSETGADGLSTRALMDELGRRFCRDAAQLPIEYARVEKMKWKTAASLLAATPLNAPIPKEAREHYAAMRALISARKTADSFDVSAHVHEDNFTFGVLGDIPSTLQFCESHDRTRALSEDHFFSIVEQYVCLRIAAEANPTMTMFEDERQTVHRATLELVDTADRLKENKKR